MYNWGHEIRLILYLLRGSNQSQSIRAMIKLTMGQNVKEALIKAG